MSCLCIGGVCIPYSAILPLLLLGLQWIAAQLAKVGLLPEWVGRKLGVSSTRKTDSKTEAKTSRCTSKSSCCPAAAESTITEAATDSEDETTNSSISVEHIDNPSRWEDVFDSSKNGTLIVKFTAEWCKPCKQIQPCYAALSKKHSKQGKCTFVAADVDECDEISSKSKVAMMPTFVCFRNGEEVGRMSGSDEEKLRGWVGEMCTLR